MSLEGMPDMPTRYDADHGLRPVCRYCGEPLPLFKWRNEDWARRDRKVYGADGDNLFCTLRHAADFGRVLAQAGHAVNWTDGRAAV